MKARPGFFDKAVKQSTRIFINQRDAAATKLVFFNKVQVIRVDTRFESGNRQRGRRRFDNRRDVK